MTENGKKEDAKYEHLSIVNTPEERIKALRMILAREKAAREGLPGDQAGKEPEKEE
ncbi:MAG: hypothetical protein QGF09_06360 [Rhodospirillales bacterium]|jgi:hypothetical protein|nr:hypothetical protein [Rhodospirillales bacterium]